MREILADVRRWVAADEAIAVATVVETEGSSPRPLGSRMAITESGQMVGSVSGGCVEGDVVREAQEVLVGGGVRSLRYTAVGEEAWEVGLACGGAIRVLVEPLVEAHRLLVDALEREEEVGLATPLDGSGHLLAWPDGRLRGDRSLASDLVPLFGAEEVSRRALKRQVSGEIFLEVFARPPTLTIVGAVHVAQPLAALAREVGFRVRLVDARRTFATRDRFPEVDDLVVAWPQEALGAEVLRPEDAVVILTHDPKFDVPALEAALSSSVGYIGLLGSTTTQAKRRGALRERGFGRGDLSRIHGPVGLDLGGRQPAEIALAILAEIIAARNT